MPIYTGIPWFSTGIPCLPLWLSNATILAVPQWSRTARRSLNKSVVTLLYGQMMPLCHAALTMDCLAVETLSYFIWNDARLLQSEDRALAQLPERWTLLLCLLGLGLSAITLTVLLLWIDTSTTMFHCVLIYYIHSVCLPLEPGTVFQRLFSRPNRWRSSAGGW